MAEHPSSLATASVAAGGSADFKWDLEFSDFLERGSIFDTSLTNTDQATAVQAPSDIYINKCASWSSTIPARC